jgi:hypothetical protein
MITKLSFLATMTLIGSLGVAVAQTRSPAASSGARTPTQVSAQGPCGTGNWAGVYVTNSNGTWNDAELFDYK